MEYEKGQMTGRSRINRNCRRPFPMASYIQFINYLTMSPTGSQKRRRRQPAPVEASPPKEQFSDVSSPQVRNLLVQLAQGGPIQSLGMIPPLSIHDDTPSTAKSPRTNTMNKKNNQPGKSSQKSPAASTSTSQQGQQGKTRRTLIFESSKMPSTSKAQDFPNKSSPPKATSVAQRMCKKDDNTMSFPQDDFQPFFDSETPLTFERTKQQQQQQRVRIQSSNHPGFKLPQAILDDLCFRFLLNIPEDEQRDEVRVCFQIELALWMYLDFHCKERADCHEVGMRDFTRQMFGNCDFLKNSVKDVDKVVDNWRLYKSNVPTYGAILLDSSLNHVLLVQGYYSKNSWGFPKGKVNEKEHPRNCAIREVYEETGYDFGMDRSNGGEAKLQKFLGDTMVRLYIVPDVPIDFDFAPTTRKEIRKIQWFKVWDLPTDKYDNVQKGNTNRFYTVYPFVTDLQAWIKREQNRRAKVASKGPKGPQGKVSALRSKDRQSAFTPVVPKTVSEKITSAMELMTNPELSPTTSTPRASLSEESRKMLPADALFRPVGNEPKGLSGSAFMHFFSTPPSNISQSQKQLAQPIPLKPKLGSPVYLAPKEEIASVQKTKPKKGKEVNNPSTSQHTTASEMEAELLRLLGKDLASDVVQSDPNEDSQAESSSGETIGKDEDDAQDSASSSSALMAQEIPLTAAIIAAEKEASEQHRLQQEQLQQALTAVVRAQAAQQRALASVQAQQQSPRMAAAQVSHGSVGSAPRSRRVSHASQLSSGAVGSPLPVFSPPRLDFSFFTPASTSSSMFGLNSGHHSNTNAGHFLGHRLNSQPQISQYPTPSAPIDVQLCEAWKDFKLDANAILSGLP
ncbi:unnamed protein product, partial [Mesorhabditis belari]|uniref:m7GpppN-mRNA hydrolase n=1 Tax=Mesorhabditis belari TaxID=2138241 RepID=A0AAF3FHT8_9BILA